MAWIESHDNLKDHPKTRRAARLLGVSVPTIIGHLHLLWHWCLSYAEDGDLSGYDAADIAEAVMWDGDPNQFIDALLNCGPAGKTGFLERDDQGRLLVHDWYDYAGRLLEKREEAREAGARGNHERWHVQRGIVDPTCPYCQEASVQDGQAIGSPSGGDSGSDSQPESEPNRVLSHRTVPNSTVHNQEEIDPLSHPKSRPQGRDLEIILAQVEGIVAQIEPTDTARALEDEVEAVFIRHGWRVERQFRVEDRGDGRRGFVDMVAWSPDGIMVALELDRQQPRQKSVEKLRHLDAVRCILLRETSGKMDAPDGIDLVYGLVKTDPRVRPVLTAFYDAYTLRFGKPPTEVVLNFGRDGKRVKKLPPAYTADELLEYIERFFRPDTPGWVTRDFSFHAFLQAIPRLQEVASGEHAAVSGGLAASGRGGGRTASPHRGREATTRLGDRLDRGFFAGVLQEDTA